MKAGEIFKSMSVGLNDKQSSCCESVEKLSLLFAARNCPSFFEDKRRIIFTNQFS